MEEPVKPELIIHVKTSSPLSIPPLKLMNRSKTMILLKMNV